MTETDLSNAPRLYVATPLAAGQTVTFAEAQAHYLRTVLRLGASDALRLFNGRDGEWRARLAAVGKAGVSAALQSQTRTQPGPPRALHLLFAPIKKHRLDFLIEKAVELGATRLHPVLTRRTENRQWHVDRVARQIVEAAEQCERLDLPPCEKPLPLAAVLAGLGDMPVFACLERRDAPPLPHLDQGETPRAVLIGPEGGFAPEELAGLEKLPGIVAVSLGPRILRSETAACYALALLGGGA